MWRDESIPESAPKKDWAWYCRIAEYAPFTVPVPAKIDGQFIERIARNHWSVGVRPLPEEIFNRIMSQAGVSRGTADAFAFPALDAVRIREADGALLIPRRPSDGSGSAAGAGRYSKIAAPVGRRAEEVAHRYIVENAATLGARNIRWVANEGLTPGWDIQYENGQGELIAIEVKGTAGPRFASIDLTVGEWNAASALGDRYWLFLVGNCCGSEPEVQRLQNPARLVQAGEAQLSPVVYRFATIVKD